MKLSRVGTSISPYSKNVVNYPDDMSAQTVPCAASGGNGDEGGGPTVVVRLCTVCGAPQGTPYRVVVPTEVQSRLALGPNKGVQISRRVPGTDEWVTCEYLPPDDEHDRFVPVKPLLDLREASIELNLAPATMYARAPFMASAEKRGSRWVFDRDLLLSVDAAGEHPVPSRRSQLAERDVRRARGEVRRAGSHAVGCRRTHRGRCGSTCRSRASQAERAAVTRSILDNLGK